jgi:DHA3 family macrolide efflux protein-like MFS transporter
LPDGFARKFADHPLKVFRDFRLLFLGRFTSAVGDKFFTIALSWYVVSHDSVHNKLHLGLLMAVNLLPVVLFGPVMGTWADRLNKKHCLMAADAGRFFFLGALAALYYADALTLPRLYLLCFAISVFVPLFEAAANSALEPLTDGAHLSRAVAVNASTVQLSSVLGAALGGMFLAALGVGGAFVWNALSYLVSLGCIARIRASLVPDASAARRPYLEEMREGFAYLRGNAPVRHLLLVFGAVNLFAAPMILFIPMIVKFILKSTVTWVALLELALSLGAVAMAAALSMASSQTRVYPKIFLGLVVMGAALLWLAAAPGGTLVLGAVFAFGAGLSLVNALALGLFQNAVPAPLKGRFFALLNTVCFAVMPLTFMLNGFVSNILPLPVVLLINGAGVVLVSLAVLAVPRIGDRI